MIALPKGGGAIRGMGEKFAANPMTGTGTMSVPLAVSPGRSGFGPQLALSYDSGAGNGPFGFGWSLALPAITRKTDKGLPQYQDTDESDVFLLSGAEDLVPVLHPDGTRFTDDTTAPGFTVHRYRPRLEGLFARIERWTRQADGDVHWRSLSKDNLLTLYGKDPNARIADPTDPGRVFTWLLCEARDDKGNAVLYDYKPEDGAGVNLTYAHERNRGGRNDLRRTANRYPKRIRYGNRVPLLDDTGQRPRMLTDAQVRNASWMFEIIFDYDEGHVFNETTSADQHTFIEASATSTKAWTRRNDPFSSYRAGFEVRTYRLCQRVLMFHHFAGEEDVGTDCLVRSTDFTYSHEQAPDDVRTPIYTFLRAVTQSGYTRHNGGYLQRSLPPVEFAYTQPLVQDTVQEVAAESLENLPDGLDGAASQWTDLHGEGIPGLLTEQGGAWFYKRNLSPLNVPPGNGMSHPAAKFAPIEMVAAHPNLTLADGQAQFMDLAGDGQPDLVVLDGPTPGLYEHDGDAGWQPFRPFTARLNRDTRDPNLKFVDLDGDGHADVLITEDDAFVWHASLAEEGFGPARRVQHALDEEKGPCLVFADGTQSIYLADLSGDGLTDFVRIGNGEVCYWPNLGYGRFGAKVTMDHAPHFDHPDQFDQKRIRLADIDGSGTTDIIYLHRDGVHLYFNQSGNSWSAPQPLRIFPRVDDLAAITPTDLLGTGTACLVWSSSLPGGAGRQMCYVDLMGGQKPHLLIQTVNNLGAETHVEYAPSTKFSLQDKRDGKPWITRLPFPVHVVERVETVDAISGNRFVTRYAYHHGYFDGEEREFRGFGLVEQWDTEAFAARTGAGTLPAATNLDTASHVPPVLTRTWFHPGIYMGRDHVSDFFAGLLDAHDSGEYYREPGLTDAQARQRVLPDTVMPPGLRLAEEREACRALKGAMLRQEVYALDGTAKAAMPYTVAEQNFTIALLQPRAGNRHAVFFTHPREALSYHYERTPADPRISHALTLEVDPYGNVLKSLAIGYGRRTASTDPALTADDKAKQTRLLITYTENGFTQAVLAADHYRTPLPAEARTYELTGFAPANDAVHFSFNEWTRNGFALLAAAVGIPYEQTADNTTRQKRLIEHVCTLYRTDDLTALLPLGEIEPLALPGESYKLALTPGLLAHVFKRRRAGQPEEDLLPHPASLLEGQGGDQGGYIAMDGNWWIPSGRTFLDPDADIANAATTAAQERRTARQHFYLPRKVADPFGHSTVVDYDAHDLLVARTRDALGNTVTGANDYRVLQPRLVTDPNRNRTAAAFDALGLVVATVVMGKAGENLGDLLEDFDADPPLANLQAFIADPQAQAAALLGKATTRSVYDLERYGRAGQPLFAATLARETHFHDPGGTQTKIQISFSYSDGFGREIQQKIQTRAGDAPHRQAPVPLPTGDIHPGDLVRNAQGKPVQANTSRRWVGSGRTVFNNKGKPVRQYEPFFSATYLYEPEREMTDIGVSPVLFYDPVERVVATLHPNHTWEKVVFDPWQQTTYDVNDTVTRDPKTDADVKGFFTLLPDADYLPTWHQQRITGAMGAAEKSAAEKTEVHADTPTIAHFDTLGRAFLTIAHNKFERYNAVVEEKYPTRVIMDIEGNQREVIDAKDRIVMRYDYDIAGPEEDEDTATNRLHRVSMEAGERWILNDVTGKPIRAWDSRGHHFKTEYDQLRRPLRQFVRGTDTTQSDPRTLNREVLFAKTEYGEGEANDIALNLRTRMFKHFDSAGVMMNIGRNPVTNQDEAYNFKGDLLRSSRDLAEDYKSLIDWKVAQPPGEVFTTSTTYDALNRPVSITAPDHSVYRPTFNEANLLDKVDVNLHGAQSATPFVTDIDYDAKGQRTLIDYGNGVRTTYEYDPLTFRLTHLKTLRGVERLQDLFYTYDPAGNITSIRDNAQQTIYFNGQVVEPHCDYVYDALYRLINAKGREHIGRLGRPETTWNDESRVHLQHPHDGQAMRNYIEQYVYDAVGNFEKLIHQATNGNWTRAYTYTEPSLIEPGKANNRLSSTIVHPNGNQPMVEPYTYDAHGNMTSMPHLSKMEWDYRDQLQATSKQVVNNGGTQETTYYVYDNAGQRVRKVTELANGNMKDERVYLGVFEIYRKHSDPNSGLVHEMLHIMDDKQRIALVETRTQRDDGSPEQLIRFQFGNHLGSTSLELDDAGQIISYEEYYPYGSTSYQAGRSAAEVSLKRYRYTGMERDEESGLEYHSARYYAPWLCRWTAADPIGLRGGVNTYTYCHNCPIGYSDSNGKEPTAKQVIGIRDFITLLKKEKVEDLEDLFHFYEDETVSEATTGSISPKISGGQGNLQSARYLYSKRWGWIDLKHFSAAAYHSDKWYIPSQIVLWRGKRIERNQAEKESERESAYSYEDLPSNLLGAYFGEDYSSSGSYTKTGFELNSFQKKLVSFLVDLEVVSDPLAIAPNAKDIPKYEGKSNRVISTPKNAISTPIFTVEPLNLERGELDFNILSLVKRVNSPFGHSFERQQIRYDAERYIQTLSDPLLIQEAEANLPRD
jgi:RHS repeat-associated protein